MGLWACGLWGAGGLQGHGVVMWSWGGLEGSAGLQGLQSHMGHGAVGFDGVTGSAAYGGWGALGFTVPWALSGLWDLGVGCRACCLRWAARPWALAGLWGLGWVTGPAVDGLWGHGPQWGYRALGELWGPGPWVDYKVCCL